MLALFFLLRVEIKIATDEAWGFGNQETEWEYMYIVRFGEMELCRETPSDEAGGGGKGGFAEARRKKYSEEKVKFALFFESKNLANMYIAATNWYSKTRKKIMPYHKYRPAENRIIMIYR